MAKSRNDILFRFLGDTKSLDKASRKARGDFKDTDKAAGKLTTGMQGVQKAFVAAGGAFAIKEAGQFILDATQMAESARMAGESADKVLGPALDGLRDRLEETRLALGFNSGEIDALFAKLGLLTEGFGLTDDAQAEFIENMVITAGDLAAFNGRVGESEGAIDALTAAIRGEFDPLEQWGVKLKQSEINERALELQAEDTTGELSDQEAQIAAITDLINEKAAPAIGALSDAEGTLGVETNEATAKLEDLKIAIGEELTPVVIKAAEKTLNFVDGLTFLADESVPVSSRLGALATAFSDIWIWVTKVWLALQPIALLIRGIGVAAETAGRQLGTFVDGLKGIINNPLSGIKFPDINFPSVSLPGFRASGGPVTGGQPYVVGEQGPEVVVPGRSGTVIPNNRLGGGAGSTVVNVNFNGVVGDPAEVAQQIKDLLEFGDRVDGLG